MLKESISKLCSTDEKKLCQLEAGNVLPLRVDARRVYRDREKKNIRGNLFEIESFSQREGEIVATAQVQVLSVTNKQLSPTTKKAMLVSK